MGKWTTPLMYIAGGALLGYFMKDQIGQFLYGLQNKATSSMPQIAAPMPYQAGPAPVAPVGGTLPQQFGAPQAPVQSLAGEALYEGAFPPQDYSAENEYYGVSYATEATNLLVPGRRFDRDYTKYSQADVNSLPSMW